MQGNKEKNLIAEMTFDFALKSIKYAELLEKDRRFVLATQLLKAGTCIGANAREAQNAESIADFVHKMKIAAKEADEASIGCCFVTKRRDILIVSNCWQIALQ